MKQVGKRVKSYNAKPRPFSHEGLNGRVSYFSAITYLTSSVRLLIENLSSILIVFVVCTVFVVFVVLYDDVIRAVARVHGHFMPLRPSLLPPTSVLVAQEQRHTAPVRKDGGELLVPTIQGVIQGHRAIVVLRGLQQVGVGDVISNAHSITTPDVAFTVTTSLA